MLTATLTVIGDSLPITVPDQRRETSRTQGPQHHQHGDLGFLLVLPPNAEAVRPFPHGNFLHDLVLCLGFDDIDTPERQLLAA